MIDQPRWVYRVDGHAASGLTMLSYGTRRAPAAAQALADDVAARARTEHSFYTGDLVVRVWPERDGEHYALDAPSDAIRTNYPAGHPAVPAEPYTVLRASVHALAAAEREHRAALTALTALHETVTARRSDALDGRVVSIRYAAPYRAHRAAQDDVACLLRGFVTRARWDHEAAALAYAYGAFDALRAVAAEGPDGPVAITYDTETGIPTGSLTLATEAWSGPDLAVTAAALTQAADALSACCRAAARADAIAGRPHLSDAAQDELDTALAAARGLGDAAARLGGIAERALRTLTTHPATDGGSDA
jgi:hypothetical protein